MYLKVHLFELIQQFASTFQMKFLGSPSKIEISSFKKILNLDSQRIKKREA